MDKVITELLLKRQKEHAKEGVSAYVGKDPERLKALVEIIFGPDRRLSQYASWPLSRIAEHEHELISPYHGVFLEALQDPRTHVAIRRNLIRLYQWADIPEDIEGALYDVSMQFISDPEEAIAVKAFASSVALRIVERYPDLGAELRSVIEQQYEFASSGLKNRFGKILFALEKVAQ